MTRRLTAILLSLVLASTLLAGCQQKVSVESGERVVCRYGDVIRNDVHSIQVPADEVSRYGVRTETGLCERHERLLSMYVRAQNAIEKGDLKTAQVRLKAVVAGDPDFEQARKQLTEIIAGRTPAPDRSVSASGGGSGSSSSGSSSSSSGGSSSKPSTGGTSKPGESGKPVGPVAGLAAWAPEKLDGFSTRSTAADALALSREYVPSDAKQLEALVISVEQFSDKSAAARALKAQMAAYPQDAASVTLGKRTGSFGTDGREFAVIGLTDGALVIVLEGHAQKGMDPAALKTRISQVAGTLPR